MAALSGQYLRVFIAIASRADAVGRAYPSLARIAELTGVMRQNVPRAIAVLETAGLIRRERRRDAPGDCDHSVYFVIFDEEGVFSRMTTPVLRADDGVFSGTIHSTDHRTVSRSAGLASARQWH